MKEILLTPLLIASFAINGYGQAQKNSQVRIHTIKGNGKTMDTIITKKTEVSIMQFINLKEKYYTLRYTLTGENIVILSKKSKKSLDKIFRSRIYMNVVVDLILTSCLVYVIGLQMQ